MVLPVELRDRKATGSSENCPEEPCAWWSCQQVAQAQKLACEPRLKPLYNDRALAALWGCAADLEGAL